MRTATQSTRYLVVGCGSAVLAFPADLVRGILTPAETGLQTTLTVASETYYAADMRPRLGLSEAADNTPEARTVLCSYGAFHRAVHVDQVLGLTEIERAQIMALPPHFRGTEREWFAGLFLYRDGVALVLNPVWLLNEHELPALTSAGGDRQAVNLQKAAAEVTPGRSRSTILVAPWLQVELDEANDAEDTPWAQI